MRLTNFSCMARKPSSESECKGTILKVVLLLRWSSLRVDQGECNPGTGQFKSKGAPSIELVHGHFQTVQCNKSQIETFRNFFILYRGSGISSQIPFYFFFQNVCFDFMHLAFSSFILKAQFPFDPLNGKRAFFEDFFEIKLHTQIVAEKNKFL